MLLFTAILLQIKILDKLQTAGQKQNWKNYARDNWNSYLEIRLKSKLY